MSLFNRSAVHSAIASSGSRVFPHCVMIVVLGIVFVSLVGFPAEQIANSGRLYGEDHGTIKNSIAPDRDYRSRNFYNSKIYFSGFEFTIYNSIKKLCAVCDHRYPISKSNTKVIFMKISLQAIKELVEQSQLSLKLDQDQFYGMAQSVGKGRQSQIVFHSLMIVSMLSLAAAIIFYTFYRKKQRANCELINKINEQNEILGRVMKDEMSDMGHAFEWAYNKNSVLSNEMSKMEDTFNRFSFLMKEKELYTEIDITRKSIADLIGVSDRLLYECIKSNTGMGFAEYITYLRLEHACKLLADSTCKLTLEAIAFDSGFGSRATFYRIFRDKYSATPQEYRKKTQEQLLEC